MIEAWAWCDICEDMVALKLDKKEITDGLKMGIYTKEYQHSNSYPDSEDPEDLSGQQHTIYVYINDNYDITGVKSFFGDAPSLDEVGAETMQSGGEVRIPIVVKDIPPMAVQLGMLSHDEFKVLKICDGMNTLEQCAEIAQKSTDEIEKMMEKLRSKGLVKVIRRTSE